MRYKEGFYNGGHGRKKTDTLYNIRTRVNKNGKRKKRIRKQKAGKNGKRKKRKANLQTH